jgi:protein required for attachment to host cells
MKWIVTANSNKCCFYSYDSEHLKELKALVHPESNFQELIIDKPVHYKVDDSRPGAYEPHTEPQKIESEKFVQEIAKELNHGRVHNQFDGLVIIMPAQMEGLLSKHLNKEVQSSVKEVLHKNIIDFPKNELHAYIREHV